MKRAALVGIVFLASCVSVVAQAGGNKPKPGSEGKACSADMRFCWYGDEVVVFGQRWTASDSNEKPIVAPTQLRCLKQLSICVKARATTPMGETLVGIDVLPIARWDSDQIVADGEGNGTDPCERETYIVSRIDKSVTLIDAPGPGANGQGCKSLLGKPRTITYKFSN